MINRSDFFLTFRFDSRCGDGAHAVSLAVAPWGTVETTTICDLLPDLARGFARSDCRSRLDYLCAKLRVLVPQQCFFVRGRVGIGGHADPGVNVCEWLPKIARTILRDACAARAVTTTDLRAASAAADPPLRWAAAVLAGVRGDGLLLPDLLNLTRDPDVGVQVAAIWASTEVANIQSVAVLEECLLNPVLIAELWRKVVDTLETLGVPVMPVLSRTLMGRDYVQKQRAARALARLSAIEPVLDAVNSGNRRAGEIAAAATFAQMSGVRGVEALLEAVSNEYDSRRAGVGLDARAVEPLVRAFAETA